MAAIRPIGTAPLPWVARSRTIKQQVIRRPATPATRRPRGQGRPLITPGFRSRTTDRFARTATRFRPTTHNLRASIATRTLLRTGPGCRTPMFALHLHHAGTSTPPATTATRMAGARMRANTVFDPAVIVLTCLAAGLFPGLLRAQVISSVAITQDAHRTSIRVEGAGHLDVHAERVHAPERLALDFAGARLKVQRTWIPGASAPVRGVRMGQFQPDVARVVIDLTTSVPYQIAHEGDAVVVYLQVEPSNTKAPPPAASVASEKPEIQTAVTATPLPTNSISASNKDSDATTTPLPPSNELTHPAATTNAFVQLPIVQAQDPGASTTKVVPVSTPPAQDPGASTTKVVPVSTPPAQDPAASTTTVVPVSTPPAQDPAGASTTKAVPASTPPAQDPAGASTTKAVPAWTPPAQDPTSAPKPDKQAVFHVKYISDTTLYIDAGHNAG